MTVDTMTDEAEAAAAAAAVDELEADDEEEWRATLANNGGLSETAAMADDVGDMASALEPAASILGVNRAVRLKLGRKNGECFTSILH